MEDNKKDSQFPEAGAVAFFGYKRVDGFEISLTLKDETGEKLLVRLEGAIKKVKEEKGTPLPLRNGPAFTKPQKPTEYVKGVSCPLCSNSLVYSTTKAGKRFAKCSTNKYSNGQATGCKYVAWNLDANGMPVQPKETQGDKMDGWDGTEARNSDY